MVYLERVKKLSHCQAGGVVAELRYFFPSFATCSSELSKYRHHLSTIRKELYRLTIFYINFGRTTSEQFANLSESAQRWRWILYVPNGIFVTFYVLEKAYIFEEQRFRKKVRKKPCFHQIFESGNSCCSKDSTRRADYLHGLLD